MVSLAWWTHYINNSNHSKDRYSTHYPPNSILSTLHISICVIFAATLRGRKSSYGERKQLAEGHTVSECKSKASNPGSLAPVPLLSARGFHLGTDGLNSCQRLYQVHCILQWCHHLSATCKLNWKLGKWMSCMINMNNLMYSWIILLN